MCEMRPLTNIFDLCKLANPDGWCDAEDPRRRTLKVLVLYLDGRRGKSCKIS